MAGDWLVQPGGHAGESSVPAGRVERMRSGGSRGPDHRCDFFSATATGTGSSSAQSRSRAPGVSPASGRLMAGVRHIQSTFPATPTGASRRVTGCRGAATLTRETDHHGR